MLGCCKILLLNATELLLNFNAVSVVTVTQGNAYVPLSLRTSIQLGMGGFCTRKGGCNTIKPHVSIANQCRHLIHFSMS